MKPLFGLLFITLTVLNSVAQNEIDALRYSQLYYSGTARSIAMGGAFSSLGADFSVLSTNPAGIAMYKGGDVSFTPTLFYQQTESSYNNNLSSDVRIAMNCNNAGIAYSRNKGNESSLLHGFSFGVAYNRTNNFSNAMRIDSKNNNSSILDTYVAEANGINPSSMLTTYPFSSGLAWDLYLLDTIPGDTTNYFSVVPNGGTTQEKYIETIGGSGELAMTMGFMIGSRLYLGATLGFPSVRYVENSTYTETDEQDTIATLDNFTVYNHLRTTGSGINFKAGLIYRIADFVRISGAIHSPTVLQLTDNYYTEMSRVFDDGSSQEISTLDLYPDGGVFDYQLLTPMRMNAGVAFIIAKMGAISADYELVDYSSSRLSANDYGFFDENDAITVNYKPTSNLKVGTEWKIRPVSLRAGYAYYGSPYESNVDNDGSRSVYSIGIGLREKQYFMDFAYSFSQKLENYYMYDPEFADASAINLSTAHHFMMTLGFRF